MKRLVTAAALTLAAAAPALGQEFRFQGTLFVTAASAGCASASPKLAVGDHYVFSYRLEDRGEGFALFGQRVAYAITPLGAQRFSTAGTYSGTRIDSAADSGAFSGSYVALSIVPPTPTTATEQIQVKGTLTNFDFTTGCTIKFTASGGRRPGF